MTCTAESEKAQARTRLTNTILALAWHQFTALWARTWRKVMAFLVSSYAGEYSLLMAG